VNSERTGLLNLRALDGFKYPPYDDSRKGNRKPAVQVACMRFTKHYPYHHNALSGGGIRSHLLMY
jgi:hypothetical protein